MDQACVLVHAVALCFRVAVVNLHPVGEAFRAAVIPLVAPFSLVHLRIPCPLLVLGGTGSRDQGGIDDRALLYGHAVGLEVGLHRLKDLLAEIVRLQQMTELQDRGLIRDPVGDQGDAGKAAHRRHLDQRILHRWIAQVVPLLHQMDPQHGPQRIGRPTSPYCWSWGSGARSDRSVHSMAQPPPFQPESARAGSDF